MIRAPADTERNGKRNLALQFQKLKADIHRQLVESLDISRLHRIKPDRLRREVRELAGRYSTTTPEKLNEGERERLVDETRDEAVGLGPLEGTLNDPTGADMSVNG